MVASTLAAEEALAAGVQDAKVETAWSRQMLRDGSSFNGNQRNTVFIGRGDGTFEDLSDLTGADAPLDARAALAADFDDDGDVDLFVHNIQRERHQLYRNELEGEDGFVKIRLRATTGQYEAIGAVVTVEGPLGPVAQVLSRGAGFASCQAPELVFGLGAAKSARVSVLWPGGARESFGALEAGSRALLVEGEGEPDPLPARPFRLADPLPDGLKLDVGAEIPPLTLLDRDGKRVTIDVRAEAAGDTLYVNFWAGYCKPCRAELPALERVHDTAGKRVITISVDVPDDRPAAARVLAEAGTSFPDRYLSQDDADNEGGLDEVVDLLRLPIPTTLVISPAGKLEAVIQGPLDARAR